MEKTNKLSSPTTSEYRLEGNWLIIARLGWVAFTLLTLALIVAGIPGRYGQLVDQYTNHRSTLELGISATNLAAYILGLNLSIALAHSLIAAVIFWRKSEDWIALFVSFTLVSNGAILPLHFLYFPGLADPGLRTLINLVISTGLMSSVIVLFLFPNGRFVPHWTRLFAITWVVFALIFPVFAASFRSWPSPLQIAVILLLLGWTGVGVFAQAYRYWNVSNPIQKQQTKWAVLGLTAAVVGPFQYILPFVILPALSEPTVLPNILYQRVGAGYFTFSFLFQMSWLTIFRIATLLFPLSFAIAVLRYRLWDIDLLINRALVYGTLTGTLALVYFSAIILLQSVFRALTGRGQSEIVTVISTLAIATLFTPLRRGIQAEIDRRFYRGKYDAAQALADFSGSLRHEVDIGQLTERLLAVIEDTMQPEHVSLWLRTPPRYPTNSLRPPKSASEMKNK